MECCSPARWRRFPSSAPTRRRTVAFTASLSPSHHHHHHSSGYHKLPHRPPFDQSRYGAGDGIIDLAPSLRAPSIFSRARQETINDVNRDNNTIGVGDGGSRSAKAYQVAISCRGLRWEHLQVYFSLEFPETRVPLDQKVRCVANGMSPPLPFALFEGLDLDGLDFASFCEV